MSSYHLKDFGFIKFKFLYPQPLQGAQQKLFLNGILNIPLNLFLNSSISFLKMSSVIRDVLARFGFDL